MSYQRRMQCKIATWASLARRMILTAPCATHPLASLPSQWVSSRWCAGLARTNEDKWDILVFEKAAWPFSRSKRLSTTGVECVSGSVRPSLAPQSVPSVSSAVPCPFFFSPLFSASRASGVAHVARQPQSCKRPQPTAASCPAVSTNQRPPGDIGLSASTLLSPRKSCRKNETFVHYQGLMP
jgi:hypothetical protein